ncbi:MAG: transporter substrate-binding protein [Paenibacillaceae bacterium]|nr:transporter substrate-binding protein [Paenibacillaceae bacterium]
MTMNKRSRLLALALTAALPAGMFAGCAKEEETAVSSTSPTAAATAKENLDPAGKYAMPITVTTAFSSNAGTDEAMKKMVGETYEKNRFTDLYKERLNIDLKYTFISDSTQYDNKVNVTIASGDIPDFMMVNADQVRRLVEADLIIPVGEAFDKYAIPRIKDGFAYQEGLAWKPFTHGGKKMAIPVSVQEPIQSSADLMWIRTDWLHKLDLPEPKTMDDVLNIMKAFVMKDPDGNSKQDTIGMGINNALWSYMGNLTGFFNGFGAYPNQWLEDSSGKLVNGSIQPEVKTALKKLQDMYREGYLDKEFAVKKDQQVREDYNSGKAGLLFSQLASGTRLGDTKKSIPGAEWKAYPVPGKTGLALSMASNQKAFVISKKAKNPEAVIKMMNLAQQIAFSESKEDSERYFTSAEVPQSFVVNPLGSINTMSEKNAYISSAIDESLKTNDPTAAFAKIKNNAGERDFTNSLTRVNLWLKDKDISGYGSYLVFGPTGSGLVSYSILKSGSFILDKFTGAPTVSMTEKKSTLDKLRDEIFVKIIMGAADADEEFDKFTINWKKLGGDDITAEVNEWYSANKSK